MAVIIKNLASGSGSISNKYPGAGKSWIVKNIIVTNSGTSTTLTLKAVSKFIAPPLMTLAANTTMVFSDEITLTGTEALDITVAGGTVDYVVNGVERDV